MAFSLNKIMLIGNLGRDAEFSFTQTTNTQIGKFAIATTYSYKGKDGNWVDETTWHNVVVFNPSDFYRDQLKKGKRFFIEGRLSIREYKDKEDKTQRWTEVVAERLIPLDQREERGARITSEDKSPSYEGQNYPQQTNNDDDLPF